MNMHKYAFLFVLCSLFTSCSTENTDDKALIKKKVEAYVEAYNKHDPKSTSSFWAENAEYINPETGETIQGRAAIETSFKERFTEFKDAHLEAKLSSITFPSQNQALAVGTFHIKGQEKEDDESAFKAFFEKQNGNWVITKVRDIDIAATPDQYQHLKELEWLIGDWVDSDEDVEIHGTNRWNDSKNLIMGTFSVITEGKKELDGTQIIAWDPIKQKIRSWVFDSDGGFGESLWDKKGNSWVATSSQVLANGDVASAVNIFTPIDSNSYKWESTDRVISGDMLPDIEPVLIVRAKSGVK